jgi:hypothetical protein
MSLTISAEQRDALYDQILDRLSGIGDIEIAIKAGKFEIAERLGREFSDDLRLLVEDVGFGESDGKPVALTTPPDVLERILPRMREAAEKLSASQEDELAEAREMRDRSRLVAQACTSVLDELGGGLGPPRRG